MRVFAAAVAVLVVGVVAAQEPALPHEIVYDVGFMSLLRNEAVQKELKMTPEQSEQSTAAFKGFNRKVVDFMTASDPHLRPDLSPEQRTQARLRIVAELHKEFRKEVEKVLQPDQVKRARQIEVQALGVAAFREPDVLKELKLTDGQQKAVAEIVANSDRESMAATRGAFVGGVSHEKIAEVGQKLKAIHKKEFEAMVATLTDEQKKVWKGIVGEPFDLSKLVPAFLKKMD